MPKRKDLRAEVPCPHRGAYHEGRLLDGFKRHPLGESVGFNRGGSKIYAEWCNGPTEATDAELLDILFPDIDWDALREAIETLTDGPLLREMTRHNAEAFAEAVGMMAGLALRLLALHDGSTNE